MKEALFIDYYELTMANAYYHSPLRDTTAYFDYFFRTIPDGGGYVIFAGLGDCLDYLKNLSFSADDIEFLKAKKIFSDDFLNYLAGFHFTGDVYAVSEGTVVFPGEPLVTIRANIIEAQIIETYLLMTLNHQSRIATKASRITLATGKSDAVMEFGARRCHGFDAGINGAKAAYIGGCMGSSLTACDKMHQVPALGTMAHSFVQAFSSEYDAFLAYAKTYPDNVVLLIDTYNSLTSGIKNAIKLYHNYLKPNKLKLKGVRIDSGDLVYLSKKIRHLLDAEGLTDTAIIVSNSLDEYLITSLIQQGAQIDSYGVGERLITAKSDPVLDGVYKLCALEEDNKIIPKIKLSNTLAKTTTPGFKQIYRFYDTNQMAIADLITLDDETIPLTGYTLFDPLEPWKQKQITNYSVKKLTQLVMKNGKQIIKNLPLPVIKDFVKAELKTLWDEVKRFANPHKYYVDLSQKLWDLKQKLITNDQNKS